MRIKKAINARRIMVNDLTAIDENTVEYEIPYLIWWPLKPQPSTLSALWRKRPDMTEQIAIACIVCNYKGLYEIISPTPSWHLHLAAEQSPTAFYLEDLKKRAAEQGISIADREYELDGSTDALSWDLEPTDVILWSCLHRDSMDDNTDDNGTFRGIDYDRNYPKSSRVDLHIWASPELLRKIDVFCDGFCEGDPNWLEDKTLPAEDALMVRS